MTNYVQFPLANGGTIIVEAPEEERRGGAGFNPASRGGDIAQLATQAKQSFDESLENVRQSADLLVSKLRSISQPPDEMEVQFALKVSADLGNFAVGTVGGEANYQVTLKWRKEEAKKEEKDK